MPESPGIDLTGPALICATFQRLRPRLLAMIDRRIGGKLAARVDPEGVIQESYLRACRRWQELSPRPPDLDAWVYRQVLDRLIELVRSALGQKNGIDHEIPWPEGSAAPLAEHLVATQTGPVTALSRAERCEMVRAALERLDGTDREILVLRHFDGLNFAQIGVILGLSQNAANKRALRALVQLRDLIPAAYRPSEASEP